MKPLTLDELVEEVRQGRTPPLDAWSKARAYERSLLPPDTQWPVGGEVYECTIAHDVALVTHWSTAFTGGGTGQLQPGDQIQICEVLEEKPVIVSAIPLDSAGLRVRLIPVRDREHPNFAGYSLSIRIRDLISYFRLRR
jgi:hypothetical protein